MVHRKVQMDAPLLEVVRRTRTVGRVAGWPVGMACFSDDEARGARSALKNFNRYVVDITMPRMSWCRRLPNFTLSAFSVLAYQKEIPVHMLDLNA